MTPSSPAAPGQASGLNACRLEIPVDVDFLPVVGSFIGTLAECYGVPELARPGFRQSVVQLVQLIIDRAFAPGDLAKIDVNVVPIAGGLEIVIHDRGLPFDPEQWTTEGASAVLEQVRGQFDQVRFLNLGPEGHETRLLKYFQRLLLEADQGGHASPPDSDSPLEIRRLRHGEGLQVSRCVYRCYGYSYGSLEAAYYPERLEALNESHEILSLVAATPSGEVAGHLALERSGPDFQLATAGVAAVLPEFRSRGLAQKLTVQIMEEARQHGVEELQAFAVTSHPFSQKLAHSFGLRSIAIYLATAYFNFKGIREEGGQRETLVGLYLRLGAPPQIPETLHVPNRHRAMVEALCQHIDRPVIFADVPSFEGASGGGASASYSLEFTRQATGRPKGTGSSNIQVKESPIRNLAKIHVARFGEGWLEQVRAHVRYLRQQDYRQFILSLPLRDPHTAEFTRHLEKLGFFFAGVQVREEGLCLVLQFLHGVTVDYPKIVVVEPMAKELLAYVRVQDPGRI